MSDDLSIQGTLAETTVPDLFRMVVRSGETAIASLEATERHDNIYFREGRIVFATSSDPDLGLAEVLLRTGELNLQQYQRAIDAPGVRHIGTTLCELGLIKPDELTRALELQVSNIVMHALACRSGSYTLEFVPELPREIVALTLQNERLILDGVGRLDHWSLIQRGIGSMKRLLRHAPDADARTFHLVLTDEEEHVYGLLGEPQTVEMLCDRSYLSNFAVCRSLWALLTVNLLEDADESVADERRSAVEGEYELEGDVEKFNSCFQGLYHLVEGVIGDHIYDFVDRIVVQLSPEVLPYLSGINLLNEGRVDFDQLLNNLIASGSVDRRRIVQDVLNELLYGWIFEIKSEFKGRLDPQMQEILNTLR